MNITEILKNAPKGTKLYSPILGEVELCEVNGEFIYTNYTGFTVRFYSDGKYNRNGECMLFPSRENRDWSTFNLNKFDINTLKPFDKVLVRDANTSTWRCELYSHYINRDHYKYACSSGTFCQCIPYNDDTKHLIGTDKDCPEYYKTW